MLHPDLVDRMVRMLSPTELNLRKRRRLVKLISEYVPEDRLLRILDGNYASPLTEGSLRGGIGLVKKLGPSAAPSAPPPAPVKDVRKGVVKMQEHEAGQIRRKAKGKMRPTSCGGTGP
ncbi:hypothetical protein LCGC14_2918150 [marine sediment metagenome]|uniref:Uncharacterized protein n=1 Tax=marine sediment metagenome TaxID=412755 RepID=A0A0F8XPU4_9ZZZZ